MILLLILELDQVIVLSLLACKPYFRRTFAHCFWFLKLFRYTAAKLTIRREKSQRKHHNIIYKYLYACVFEKSIHVLPIWLTYIENNWKLTIYMHFRKNYPKLSLSHTLSQKLWRNRMMIFWKSTKFPTKWIVI